MRDLPLNLRPRGKAFASSRARRGAGAERVRWATAAIMAGVQ
jgi:hypothetical protein